MTLRRNDVFFFEEKGKCPLKNDDMALHRKTKENTEVA